jgi:hypothetical protein
MACWIEIELTRCWSILVASIYVVLRTLRHDVFHTPVSRSKMIHLKFEDNKSGHDDLVLTFPGGEHRCDSYYFAIDSNFDPNDESLHKLLRVVHQMLAQWLDVVRKANDSDTVFLPFDFSDQCTGWIRCQFAQNGVQLDVGWSSIEGWSFCPSDIADKVRSVSDFHAIENPEPIMMDRDSLVAVIESNMAEFVVSGG